MTRTDSYNPFATPQILAEFAVAKFGLRQMLIALLRQALRRTARPPTRLTDLSTYLRRDLGLPPAVTRQDYTRYL